MGVNDVLWNAKILSSYLTSDEVNASADIWRSGREQPTSIII